MLIKCYLQIMEFFFMKKLSTFFAVVFSAILLFGFSEAKAQLIPGTFGLNTEFGSGASELSMLYTLSNNFELGLGVGFESVSQEGSDAQSTIGVNAYGAYFLSKGDVNPYLTVAAGVMMPPKETSAQGETTFNNMDFSFAFGGQVFVTKNFAVYVEAGVDYTIESAKFKPTGGGSESTSSTNFLSLFTSAVGASLYFW